MSETPDPTDIVAATDRLTAEVHNLGSRLRISEEALKRQETLIADQAAAGRVQDQILRDQKALTSRTQAWLKFTSALVVVMVVALIVVGVLYHRVNEAVDANQRNAVTNCQNANESRRGTSIRWNYVIDVNLNNPKITDVERTYLEQVRTWFNKLDAARDCSDLSRKYPLPDPPPILKRR